MIWLLPNISLMILIFCFRSLAVIIFAITMLFEKKNKLTYNFFFLSIVQVINSLLQLLVIPYVIGIIGADGFGVVAVAQAVMFYLSAFTDYGFNQTATRDIAIYRTDSIKISQIFFRTLFSKLFLCLLAFVILLTLVLFVPFFRAHAFLYLMAFVFVIGQSSLVTWFFQGLEKMQFIAFATLTARLLFVFLVFFFIKCKNDGFLFLFFFGIGNLAAGAISFLAAWKMFKLQFIKPSWPDIRQDLKEGWHISVSNLSNYGSQYTNIFILRLFTNDLIVGYYSIAERIFFAMRQVLANFSQVIYPKVCRLIQSGRSHVILFFRQIYFPFLLCVMAGCALVFIFSNPILHYFSDYKNEEPVFLLRLMCVITVIVCINIPACLVLLAADKKKNYLRISAIGSLLNIMANIILVPFFTAKGTVLSIGITELFITAGFYWEIYRLFGITEGERKTILK
jgi:polysaccharide transporter, PST family